MRFYHFIDVVLSQETNKRPHQYNQRVSI
jgi:hypothetical protein